MLGPKDEIEDDKESLFCFIMYCVRYTSSASCASFSQAQAAKATSYLSVRLCVAWGHLTCMNALVL